MISELSGTGSERGSPFSVTVRIGTELRPYVGIFAVLLFWYQQTVSIDTTNNSDTVYNEITIHLRGRPEMQGCDAIDETFMIPRLAPHDSDMRTFWYKRKIDCRYSFFPEVVSYR
jgi:hypothetical protein